MTMQNLLLYFFQKDRPYYIEWDTQPAHFKEHFVMHHEEMGQYQLIIALSSWKDLPIPSILQKEIQPQANFFKDWEGVSKYTRNNTFKVMTWFSLMMKDELIKPRRAYFLNLAEPIDCYNWEENIVAEFETSYIAVFKWHNIIFLCGKIISSNRLLVGEIDNIYRWLKQQAPPKNLNSYVSPLSNDRLHAYERWLQQYHTVVPLHIARVITHQVHRQLPKKVHGYRFVYRGYAQVYAVTYPITARIHPEFQDDNEYDMAYEWKNEYCIVINLAKIQMGVNALNVIGKIHHETAHSPHPHVNANGGCCYGTFDRTIEALFQEFDLTGVLQVAQNFCAVINPNSQLVHFPEVKAMPTYSCDHCGAGIYDEDDLYHCAECGNELCQDCREYCDACQREIGKCCGDSYYCEWCENYYCENHSFSCKICEETVCDECSYACDDCGETICGSEHCRGICVECNEGFCKECLEKLNGHYYCKACAEEFKEENVKCNYCGRYFDLEEIDACFKCGVIRCTACLYHCDDCQEDFCGQCCHQSFNSKDMREIVLCETCLRNRKTQKIQEELITHG